MGSVDRPPPPAPGIMWNGFQRRLSFFISVFDRQAGTHWAVHESQLVLLNFPVVTGWPETSDIISLSTTYDTVIISGQTLIFAHTAAFDRTSACYSWYAQ
eukprot:6213231-Pleurochrysis_carterae.AAC.1